MHKDFPFIKFAKLLELLTEDAGVPKSYFECEAYLLGLLGTFNCSERIPAIKNLRNFTEIRGPEPIHAAVPSGVSTKLLERAGFGLSPPGAILRPSSSKSLTLREAKCFIDFLFDSRRAFETLDPPDPALGEPFHREVVKAI